MTDARRRAEEIVSEWERRGFVRIDPGHRHALIADVADAVAQAVKEREEEHKDQLAALRVTWEQKDRDLTMAKLTLVHAQRQLDQQAEEIARLKRDVTMFEDGWIREREQVARLRAALEAIAMRTDGPSFHLGGDIRGIINEALRADAL